MSKAPPQRTCGIVAHSTVAAVYQVVRHVTEDLRLPKNLATG